MLYDVIYYGRIGAFVIKQLKLEHLQRNFPKLTETNQCYVLGLAEGLKQAQSKGNIQLPKIPDSSIEAKSVFLNQD